MGYKSIKGKIENFWGKIGKGNIENFRYTCDIQLINGNRNISIDLSNPTLTEIDRTLGNLKNSKGLRLDGIPYEFFKYGIKYGTG